MTRTLLDLATVLSAHALERAIHQAEVLRLLDAHALREAARGRPGGKVVARILSEPDPGDTHEGLEDRFLELLRRARVPLPRLNSHVDVGGRLVEVDALWSAERVIVELDGAAVHRTPRAFEQDRRRDAALAARGYVVVRLTWQRVGREPAAVAAELRRILALRAS